MAMGKNYRVLEKNKPEQPHSIILEHRSRPETLLFESNTIANLCKKIIDFPPTCEMFFNNFRLQLLKRQKQFVNSTRRFLMLMDVSVYCS